MRKKIILISILLSLVIVLLSLLIILKIDNYKSLKYQNIEGDIFIESKFKLDYVFVNINNHEIKIEDIKYIENNIYYINYHLDPNQEYNINFYIKEGSMNYLSYIFKVVFNI